MAAEQNGRVIANTGGCIPDIQDLHNMKGAADVFLEMRLLECCPWCTLDLHLAISGV